MIDCGIRFAPSDRLAKVPTSGWRVLDTSGGERAVLAGRWPVVVWMPNKAAGGWRWVAEKNKASVNRLGCAVPNAVGMNRSFVGRTVATSLASDGV